MAGCQGAQPGPCSAPWWPPSSPAGRAAARLAAGAGCAGCWHKPPPADGVKPCGCCATWGALPAFGGWSFDRYKDPALRPEVDGIRTRDRPLSGLLFQTELPVVARLESNQAHPFGVASTAVPLPSACGVRHARNRQSPETPGSWHRWGEPLFKPQPVSGHRLRWMSSLLPDACQLLMDECVFCKLLI